MEEPRFTCQAPPNTTAIKTDAAIPMAIGLFRALILFVVEVWDA